MLDLFVSNPTQPILAFVSCSLRTEDRPFIDMVKRILQAHHIIPTGTVGLHHASPVNPTVAMRQNIDKVDLVVIIATPRYLQQDLQSNSLHYGLSEMVHVETGIAYAFNKPVVLFVQEGTYVGSFLPNVTQYIVLNGLQYDLDQKWPLINSLLQNSHQLALSQKQQKSRSQLGGILKGALAFIGGAALLDSFSEGEDEDEADDEPEERKKNRRKK